MTVLRRYYYMTNASDTQETYTCDNWAIPDEGTEIWCTSWGRGQTIKPYGDGCHVVVGGTVYHCDELMSILHNRERDGYTWGVDGVTMEREQRISGCWQKVKQ